MGKNEKSYSHLFAGKSPAGLEPSRSGTEALER